MSETLADIYNFSTVGLPLGKIATSIIIVLLAFVLKGVLSSTLRKTGEKKLGFVGALARDLIKPAAFMIVIIGIYLSLRIHSLPISTVELLRNVFLFLLTINILWLLMRTIDAVSEQMGDIAAGTESRMDDQLIPILRKLAKFIIVAIGIIF